MINLSQFKKSSPQSNKNSSGKDMNEALRGDATVYIHDARNGTGSNSLMMNSAVLSDKRSSIEGQNLNDTEDEQRPEEKTLVRIETRKRVVPQVQIEASRVSLAEKSAESSVAASLLEMAKA